MFLKNVAGLAAFDPNRMGKITLAKGAGLLAGLNCFEPGQEHAPHVHEGQDKLYYVLEGGGNVRIGDETRFLTAGDLAFAASGVVHSISNPGPGRMVVMAVLGPPPGGVR